MKVDGTCHCGNIRFEAEIDPAKVVICHCTDCQTLSGSAFRTVAPTVAGTFRLLSGEPKIYLKTADSGNMREQAFCAECGTPIYSGPVGDGDRVLGLRVGVLRQRNQLKPGLRIWHRSSLGWLRDLASIETCETNLAFRRDGGFGRP